MFRMPRILVLTAGLALIPALAAGAEEGAVVTGAAETVAPPPKTGGLFFGIFSQDPAAQQARAERRAASLAGPRSARVIGAVGPHGMGRDSASGLREGPIPSALLRLLGRAGRSRVVHGGGSVPPCADFCRPSHREGQPP